MLCNASIVLGQSEDFEIPDNIPDSFFYDYQPYIIDWIDSAYAEGGEHHDSCGYFINYSVSVLRFNSDALAEFLIFSQDSSSSLYLRIDTSTSVPIFGANIGDNRFLFDSLYLDTVYFVCQLDYCFNETIIGSISTHVPYEGNEVIEVSPHMFEAVSNFHKQDSSTAVNILSFLNTDENLSQVEILSYIQNFVNSGYPFDRSILQSTNTTYDSIILWATPWFPPDTINPGEPNCRCRIVQSNIQTANPIRGLNDESRRFLPNLDFDIRHQNIGFFTSHMRQSILRSIGPAKSVGFQSGGGFQSRRELSLIIENEIPGANGHFAMLQYNLSCINRPFGTSPNNRNDCDCVREGIVDWGYHVMMTGKADVNVSDIFSNNLAAGKLSETAWLIRQWGTSNFEVVDVATSFIEAQCNTNIDRDFLIDAILIRERMGLAILSNLTPGTDSINWANAATNIIQQIDNLIRRDSFITGSCNQPAILHKQMLGTLNDTLNRQRFLLRMGIPVKYILGSSSRGEIVVRGSSLIRLQSNSAFHLGGVVFGGIPKDPEFPLEPRNLQTCCGQYTGNYVQANVESSMDIARSEFNLLRDLGIFFSPGVWLDFQTKLNIQKGSDGVAILPNTHFGLLVSRPEDIEDCDAPIIIEKPFHSELNVENKIKTNIESSNEIFDSFTNTYKVLRIYSMSGSQISINQNVILLNLENQREILNNLPTGIYIIQTIDLNNKIVNHKIFKQ
jgi:hypothetical protein